ncbi:hypothetical protein ADL01_10475 [Streptomyces sp. NRRL WC-3618]|nr:hypothetical protein ADL01_10475 [Streptomyces sp. NRRL WC-3618]
MHRFDTYSKVLTGEDKVRVSTDGALILGEEPMPPAREVKGVGDAPEGVPGAHGVRPLGVTAVTAGTGSGYGAGATGLNTRTLPGFTLLSTL